MTGSNRGGGAAASSDEVCVLVSASCTIAWADFAHGALWLCPSGVLRAPLDPAVIHDRGSGPTVDPGMPWEATFTRSHFDDASRLGGGFRWYPRTAIMSASFEPGSTTNALHLAFRDGSHAKFLWLSVDGGRELVEEWIAAGSG